MFALTKISKIYPAYVFSLILGLYRLISKSGSLFVALLNTIIYLGLDLTLLQSLMGMQEFSHSINGVCWFLSALFICYILSPVFLKIIDRITHNFELFIAVLLTVFIVMFLLFITDNLERMKFLDGMVNDLSYGHPFIRIWYVVLGMLVGCCYKFSRNNLNSKFTFMSLVLVFIFFLYRNTLSLHLPTLVRFADLITCMLMLYTVAKGEGLIIGFLSKIEPMSKYTMYLYLFHYPVRMSVGLLIPALDSVAISNSFGYYVKALIIIAITVLLVFAYLKLTDLIAFKKRRHKMV